MASISEIAKTAIDAGNALQQSLSPALSGNAQIDAEQLVEQHRQLTATISQLLQEIAKRHVGAATQVESQTLFNSSVPPEVSKITAQFDNWDKRIILGLAKLQKIDPSRTGFSGNSSC